MCRLSEIIISHCHHTCCVQITLHCSHGGKQINKIFRIINPQTYPRSLFFSCSGRGDTSARRRPPLGEVPNEDSTAVPLCPKSIAARCLFLPPPPPASGFFGSGP